MKKTLSAMMVLVVVVVAGLLVQWETLASELNGRFCPECFLQEHASRLFSSSVALDLEPTPFPETEGWIPGDTSVSKLSQEEQIRLLGVSPDVAAWEEQQAQLQAQAFSSQTVEYPAEIDWRNHQGQDWTTPIRNQGGCGSCVAFATVAAIESRLEITRGTPDLNPDLSENHLFFCGCDQCCDNGWTPFAAMDFAIDTGIVDETCDPYDLENEICSPCSDWKERVTKIHHWESPGSFDYIKWNIANYGPVVATMLVYTDFLYYTGGIYQHTWGNIIGDHAVTLVGFNDDEGYWIAKNSWGTGWGEEGWFRIVYGQVRIDEFLYIPVIDTPDPGEICEGVTEIPEEECATLVDLYAYTHGEAWYQRTGWLVTKTPCSWYGVGCEGGHVVDLILPDNGLRGPFPLNLSSLSALATLNLRQNELTGYLHEGLEGLMSPRSMDLADNKLIGEIPSTIGNLTNLYQLRLDHNKLHGLIPTSMGNLTQLNELALSNNALLGEIPTSFTNITNLGDGRLDISYNALSTSDPDLRAFLIRKDPDWATSQTIPPTDLRASEESSTSVMLTWTPIPYTDHGGWYEAWIAEEGGYFSLHGKTLNKIASEYLVENLKPGVDYRFLVRTFTLTHDRQQNDLWSEFSEEVQIKVPLLEPYHIFVPLVKRE